MRSRRARRRLGLVRVPGLGTCVGGARLAVPRAARARRDRGCAGHGWVAVERARHAESVEECAGARAKGDVHRAGVGCRGSRGLRAQPAGGGRGRSAPGADRRMHLLEEAMAVTSRPGVRNVHTLGEAHCNLIMACTSAGEWGARRGVVPAGGRASRADTMRHRCSAPAARPMPTSSWPPAGRRQSAHWRARACGARPLRAGDGSADGCHVGVELRVRQGRPPEAERPLAAAKSIRRRCGRSPTFASRRTNRRWPPRCWNAG